jgi:hypothetical protein
MLSDLPDAFPSGQELHQWYAGFLSGSAVGNNKEFSAHGMLEIRELSAVIFYTNVRNNCRVTYNQIWK